MTGTGHVKFGRWLDKEKKFCFSNLKGRRWLLLRCACFLHVWVWYVHFWNAQCINAWYSQVNYWYHHLPKTSINSSRCAYIQHLQGLQWTVWKNENTQRAAVLWVKPLCWCHRSEGNGQIGDRKELEGNRNSNDPLLQSGYAEEPLSKHKSSKSKSWWTTAAEDHTKTQLKNTWNTLPPGSDESRFLLPYLDGRDRVCHDNIKGWIHPAFY